MLAFVLAALFLQQVEDPGPAAPPARPPAARPAPQQPAAPAPPRAAPAPRPPDPPAPPRQTGPLAGDWPEEPSGKTITLEDTANIDDTLEQIAQQAGWNIVLNTGRTGNKLLVLRLRNVPVEEAVAYALQGTMLTATRRGNTVVVAPSFAAPPAPVEVPVLSGFDAPSGRRFTGTFEGEDVGAALRALAKAGGFAIVLPPGSRGTVDAHFENTPVEDALRAVLGQAGLVAARQGEVVTVREAPSSDFRVDLRGVPPDIRADVEEEIRAAREELRRAQGNLPPGVHGDWDESRDRVVHGDVTVHAGETARNVVALFGDVRLEPGAEARDVVAVSGDVVLDTGAQAREVTAVLGDVQVGKGAIVNGNATAVGGDVDVDPEGGVIAGQVTSLGVPGIGGMAGTFLTQRAESPAWAIAGTLARFAIYFALGLLLFALFPRRLETVGASMTVRPLKTILTGFVGSILVVLLTLLLVFTVVGILLVPVVLVGLVGAAVFGFTSLAYWIGRTLPITVQRGTGVLQLAIGTAIVVLATQIPVLGWAVLVTVWLLVFGAVLRSRFGQQGPVLPLPETPPPMGAGVP